MMKVLFVLLLTFLFSCGEKKPLGSNNGVNSERFFSTQINNVECIDCVQLVYAPDSGTFALDITRYNQLDCNDNKIFLFDVNNNPIFIPDQIDGINEYFIDYPNCDYFQEYLRVERRSESAIFIFFRNNEFFLEKK